MKRETAFGRSPIYYKKKEGQIMKVYRTKEICIPTDFEDTYLLIKGWENRGLENYVVTFSFLTDVMRTAKKSRLGNRFRKAINAFFEKPIYHTEVVMNLERFQQLQDEMTKMGEELKKTKEKDYELEIDFHHSIERRREIARRRKEN